MLNPVPDTANLASRIVRWQRQSGRHDLPWQGTRDPYRIWLSEIMLQQTQVTTVIGYYQRFLRRFPDVATLAASTEDEVMPYWAGLGYYARARNLHRCARVVVTDWNGKFPPDATEISQLPGIGRSTAAAIAAFAFGARRPILDGNVKRVFTRYFGIEGDPGQRAIETSLWALAEDVVANAPPDLDMPAYTQGLMDLGATLCTRARPGCDNCPLATDCYARRTARQGDFPNRKTRKARPERHCRMLVLESGGKILLERRPAPGIWGGLWCLPQYDEPGDLTVALSRWGLDKSQARPLEPIKHDFTHFRLHIEPWLAHTANAALAEPVATQNWVAAGDLDATALPAPVKKLLARLF
ncbi:MAG TPA: A/G-specific adenine glycosylase [Burkholderiaceae bacterium]|nr:A/G-specific adenine glycosylase [Burkholderiaceae bacterium]